MPAPNLTTLFDFEGQFEAAADGILAAVLIEAFKTGDNEQLPLVKTMIGFDVGPALENKFAQLARPSSTYWPANEPPPQEYFMYSATLEFRIEVPRDDREPTITGVSTMLSQIRGRLREAMMKCVRPFNENNLPYYKVDRLRPNGTTNGVNERGNADVASLRYEIAFEIRKTAWPAWVE